MQRNITILGISIPVGSDYMHIDNLKFLQENPRVYACTHEVPGFAEMMEEEQQDVIYKKLLAEPSFTNLKPEVKRHGGLIENILVRSDTLEVIEGNSRLAVYKYLRDNENAESDWDHIPCDLVSGLTNEQQDAFLAQIHIKGKTKWSAYEKANFAFVRSLDGMGYKDLAILFDETEATVKKRVKIIQDMRDNQDNDRSRFSYYDVLVRKQEIAQGLNKDRAFAKFIYREIKNLGSSEENNNFTAQELRQKLPAVLKKPKVLKRFVDAKIDLEEAYNRAKITSSEERVRKATALLSDIAKSEVKQLERNKLNAFKQTVRKLSREVERIEKMISSCESNDG